MGYESQIGKPIVFMGFDGKIYNGTLVEKLRRGIRISYYVPEIHRECEAHLLTAEARKRVIVQM